MGLGFRLLAGVSSSGTPAESGRKMAIVSQEQVAGAQAAQESVESAWRQHGAALMAEVASATSQTIQAQAHAGDLEELRLLHLCAARMASAWWHRGPPSLAGSPGGLPIPGVTGCQHKGPRGRCRVCGSGSRRQVKPCLRRCPGRYQLGTARQCRTPCGRGRSVLSSVCCPLTGLTSQRTPRRGATRLVRRP